MRLNTHRRLSSLPGHPLPANGPAFPSRDEVIGYLEHYAKATAARIHFGTELESLSRDRRCWTLGTNGRSFRARHIVFATGKERAPKIPAWPGKENWRGRLVHSEALGDVSQYAGKSVLVVGAGNSGTDVLNHLSRVPTLSVQVAIRRGSVIVPTWLLGFPVQLGSPVMEKLPAWLVDILLAVTERFAFGNLRRFGMPSREGGATRLLKEAVSPAIDRGFVAALKEDRASIVPAVSHFEKDAVILDGGRRLHPDIVISATGYDTGLDRIVGEFGVLDERGLPETGKHGEAVKAPGLWFSGMTAQLGGYFWAARHNSGPMADAICQQLAEHRLEQFQSRSVQAPVGQPAE